MRLNSPHINLISKACLKASRSLMRDFGEIENLQVATKAPGDFVTSADKKTEKIIINELQKAHPEYGIVTEETGVINKSNEKNRWIIDPIDGTLNFLNGVPQFAISVAYEENNEILCGVILNPITNEMYCAEKGNGAYLNNSRIRVSNKSDLDLIKGKLSNSKFIFSVGSVVPHKNQLSLIQAFLLYKSQSKSSQKLVLAGNCIPGWVEYLQSMEHQDIIFLLKPSDGVISYLYTHCDFVVFPSREEGYGLPIIEAVSYGKPVISANFGVMNEVSNLAEIIIGKQRNGPIGEVRLAFLGEYTRFDNLTQNFQSGA